jgi:hypothetical protein
MQTALPSDVTAVQGNSHRVVAHLDVRDPSGLPSGEAGWIPLQVVDASLSMGELGQAPVTTLTATVLIETEAGEELIGEEAPLSIFGSWIRARQTIYREDSTAFTVWWGFYRVDSLTVDRLVGSVTLECSDALAQVAGHGLLTLAEGRVIKTDTFQARLNTLLYSTPLATIPRFWSPTVGVDWSGLANRAVGGVGAQYADDRWEAVLALTKMYASGWGWFCPATGSAFKIKPNGSLPDPGVDVKPGAFGNLVYDSYTDSVDRRDLFNSVVVTYSTLTKLSGGTVDQTQSKRVVVSYADAYEELRTTGPFGIQNRDAISLDTTTDAVAVQKGADAIGRSFVMTRDLQVKSGPIYGLEPGDRVILTQPDRWRADHDGMAVEGTLVGATIPLVATGPWDLTLRVASLLDRTWVPRPSKPVIVETQVDDRADWHTLGVIKGTKIALTTDFPKGWTVSGQSSWKGGGGLAAKGSGPITMTSIYAWTERAGAHRYRAKASVKVTHTQTVRVGIDTDRSGIFWGKSTKILGGKTASLAVDTLVPAASNKLRIYVAFTGGGTDTLNSVSMEYATRSKT